MERIMPSLAETQLPILRREIACGLVQKKHPSESMNAYYKRIAAEFDLTLQQVADELDE